MRVEPVAVGRLASEESARRFWYERTPCSERATRIIGADTLGATAVGDERSQAFLKPWRVSAYPTQRADALLDVQMRQLVRQYARHAFGRVRRLRRNEQATIENMA